MLKEQGSLELAIISPCLNNLSLVWDDLFLEMSEISGRLLKLLNGIKFIQIVLRVDAI